MSSVSQEGQQNEEESALNGADDVPRRLREAREQTGLSLRQLAQRLEISASALSQIETGKSRPSVRTLYALVSELNLSLDELFDHPGGGAKPPLTALRGGGFGATEHLDPSARASRVPDDDARSPLQKADARARLELDSGVYWERLTSQHDPLVDFLHVTYAPGSVSNSRGTLVRHAGREYGIVAHGALDVTIGFETYRCEAGDSISFSSDQPHLLANNGDEPATAIWFVVGRRGGDPRQLAFEEPPGSPSRSPQPG
jgi:transcriptional regulator with XRE-family HTH domain